jgi:hypothetical protein
LQETEGLENGEEDGDPSDVFDPSADTNYAQWQDRRLSSQLRIVLPPQTKQQALPIKAEPSVSGPSEVDHTAMNNKV